MFDGRYEMVAAVSTGPSYWIAAGIVVAFLGLLYLVVGPAGFSTLLVGLDKRTSTSKVQFALWTVALAYALLVIILHVGSYTNEALDPRYLLLLGFPAGAAIGAKAVTTNQVASKSIAKVPATTGASPKDIVTNDQGNADIGDAQYLIFNLVALTAFAVAFAHDPTKLPVLPDTLVGLTSASAVAYLLKKTVTTQSITVTGVAPSVAGPGDIIHITGSNLDGGTRGQPQVFIDGQSANVGAFSPDSITATVPDIAPGNPPGSRVVNVDLLDSMGLRTASKKGELQV
jgi:hypothetical protein